VGWALRPRQRNSDTALLQLAACAPAEALVLAGKLTRELVTATAEYHTLGCDRGEMARRPLKFWHRQKFGGVAISWLGGSQPSLENRFHPNPEE